MWGNKAKMRRSVIQKQGLKTTWAGHDESN